MSAAEKPQRGRGGKFVSSVASDEILMEILVAKFAAEDLGEPLTEAFFDRLRSKGCPTADWAVNRMKLSWVELVDLCEDPMRARRTSAVRRAQASPGYRKGQTTPEHARWALRLVGRRLGWRPSRYDYEMARGEMLRRAKRRRSADGFWMPNANQVETAMGVAFGSASHEVCSDLPLASVPKSPEAAVQLAMEASGSVRPTEQELLTFCRHNQISVTTSDARGYTASRLVALLEDPSAASKDRPDFAIDVPPSEHRRPRAWPEQECIHALALYLLDLEDGEEASQVGYQHFSSRRRDVPWYRSFPQHGGFEALLPKARELEKRMREGYDPGPTLLGRSGQRAAEGREGLWAEILDAAGHPPWDPEPGFDATRALAFLAERRSDSWCAFLAALAEPEGVQPREIVEAGAAANISLVNQWRRELSDLALVEQGKRGFETRAEGDSRERWRLIEGVDLPGGIRERAQDAQAGRPEWTPVLDETVRAIAAMPSPGRFLPTDLAKMMSTSPQNIAARLKRLTLLGAVELLSERPPGKGCPRLWGLTVDGLRHARDAQSVSPDER